MERPLRRAFLPVVIAVLVVGACAQESTITPAPTDGSVPSAVESVEPSPPGASAEPAGSPLPSEAVETESPQPTESPSPTPASSAPAAECSGSLNNRNFFEGTASSVSWPLYCAVLPDGWFVDSGRSQYADPPGGFMDISYKGPNGARLRLQEGNICTGGLSACSPKDREIGPAAFGDQQGTLVALGNGYALYVDPGSNPSWTATGTGLDQAEFVAIVQALHRVTA